MTKLDDILDEYENGQNPHQSEEYRLNKAKAALKSLFVAVVPEKWDKNNVSSHTTESMVDVRNLTIDEIRERIEKL